LIDLFVRVPNEKFFSVEEAEVEKYTAIRVDN
jgi:hypothetical protein